MAAGYFLRYFLAPLSPCRFRSRISPSSFNLSAHSLSDPKFCTWPHPIHPAREVLGEQG